MTNEINPELHGEWSKELEQNDETVRAFFREGAAELIIEYSPDSSQYQVTPGHFQYDPVLDDSFESKEAALTRAEELMLTYKEYVNPTRYTVEVELMRDSENNVKHLLAEGGYAVSENTDNQVLYTKLVGEK